MALFDTHAHLDDPQLSGDLDHYLAEAAESQVKFVTAIATTVPSSHRVLEIAQQHNQNSVRVFASVGIHPNECKNASNEDWQEIERLSQNQHVVALGETGLDKYWDFCPFEIQQAWFARHIALSYDSGLPLVIHMRDCESEMLKSLAANKQGDTIHGIMHSFCGNIETAQQCLDWGMYVSFAGMVTFKKSTELREIATIIPDDRLLIETDSPYLTPHPKRGKKPNHPALVRHTAECLAEVRGVTVEALAELTTQNAKRVFQIEPSPSV